MKPSYATTAILHSLVSGSRYGFDVMEATGLASGTVYPALRRLEKHGWIRGCWEAESEARDAKRPRRRYYEITARGIEALEEWLERYRAVRFLGAEMPT